MLTITVEPSTQGCLVAPTEQVSMVLRLTNLDRILKPRASVAAALDD